MEYLVTSTHEVLGRQPGDVVELDDAVLEARLIAGGHIEPVAGKCQEKREGPGNAAGSNSPMSESENDSDSDSA